MGRNRNPIGKPSSILQRNSFTFTVLRGHFPFEVRKIGNLKKSSKLFVVLQGLLGLTFYANCDSTNIIIDINAPAFLRLCLDKYEAELQLNTVKMKAHLGNVFSCKFNIFVNVRFASGE